MKMYYWIGKALQNIQKIKQVIKLLPVDEEVLDLGLN